MLNAPTKKTVWAPSGVSVQPGPLPGTEPGAGSLFKPKFGLGQLGAFIRLFKFLLILIVVSAAVQVLVDTNPTIKVGNGTFAVKVADTDPERVQGLSKTPSLAPNEGMLFIFDQPNYWPIWMKDMNYPIDIVWLDANKKVVTVNHGISPSTYPDVFMSVEPAMYALEIPAGEADNNGISYGQTADFNLGNAF